MGIVIMDLDGVIIPVNLAFGQKVQYQLCYLKPKKIYQFSYNQIKEYEKLFKKRLIRLNEINPVSLFSLFKIPETRTTP